MSDVLVVGAGPAGLSAARALRACGIEYDHVERHTDVGGIWDRDNPNSPIYESAHFISSKTLSGYIGYPMPNQYPDYPNRQQILDYVRGFADHFGLHRMIRFGVGVVSATPLDGGGWTVSFDDGVERQYRAVVATVGTQWLPTMPSYPGSFNGELRHSSTYWNNDELRGKRVLVVGGGNSGFDIACDAARTASHAALSLRRGYWVIPKHIFGQPVDVFVDKGPHLPNRVAQPILARLLRTVVGKQERFGLPKPDHKVMETHPVLNSQVFHYLSHGDLEIRPDIASFDRDDVIFTDRHREPYDVVLCATGFRHEVPFLPAGTIPTTKSGRPKLLTGVFVPGRTDLFVPGMFETNSGGYHLYDRLNLLVAQTLRDTGPDSPPARAQTVSRAVLEPVDLRGGIKFVDSPRNEDYVDAHALEMRMKQLNDALGWGDPAAVLARNPRS